MSQDLNLRLRITGDGSGLKGEIRTASGEVVKFSDTLEGGAKRGTRALRDTEKQTGRLTNTTQQLTRRIAAVAAGYLSFQGVSRTLRTITENTLEQERVWRQLEAGIAATGGAAGRSLGQLQAMSSELQSTTTFANEQVEQVQAQMLAFRNISENVFDRTLRLVLDFAQTTGRDATQGVRTLALAINDPLQGMGRLSQAGISLNKELQETVRELVETGELTKAQNLLLDELTASFGGAAAAARDTFGGALQALRNDFDDLLKYTGDMPELAAEIEAISERLRDPELVGTIEEGIAAALGLIPPAVNAGVSALELIIPLMNTTAENADKIGIAVKALATVLAARLVASIGSATTQWVRYQATLATMAGLTKTAAAGQLALAGATRTAAAAYALMGGPVGAVVIGLTAAAWAIKSNQERIEALSQPTEEAADAFERMRAATQGAFEKEQVDQFRVATSQLNEEIRETEEALERATMARLLNKSATSLNDSAEQRALRERLDAYLEEKRILQEVARERRRLNEQLSGEAHHQDLANGLELLSRAGDSAIDVLERMGLVSRNAAGGLGEMAAARGEIVDPIDEQIAALEREAAVLRMVAEESRSAAEAQLEYQYQIDLAAAREADAADATNANVAAVKEKYARLRELTGQVEDYQQASDEAAKADQKHAQQMQKLAQAYGQLLSAANPTAAKQRELNQQLQMMQELAGLSAGELQQMGVSSQQVAQIIEYLRDELEALGDTDGLGSLSQEVQDILDWVDQMDVDPLVRDIKTLEEALADATDPEVVERLQEAIGRLRQELGGAGLDVGAMMAAYAEGTGQALRSIQQLTEVGSKEYQAIEVAIAAANLQAAIAAILNQGMGDPYTAPFRMAAMASAVAGLVGSIQGFGGGMDTTAQDRQERQGTGSVLGDSEAKSESILNASETTAAAVSQLPGINRGMARNLQRLADGIAGASGMLARGAGDSEFSFGTDFAKYENAHNWGAMGEIWKGVEFALDPLGLFGGLFDWVGELFGGDSKVVDEGIAILGGTIGELIDDTLVQAFQEVKYKKWVFGSSKRETAFADLDDDLARQFQLIFESIADTVAEGAVALGLSRDEIEAAIQRYEVEAQEISLKDLTAEEQQAELEAVFSKIFDGLAGHVIDFLPQFQQVGEGLADTLVRVATGVQVNEEAMRRFGWAVDQSDPERFAQISESLINLVGGLDPYMSGINSFFDRFAPAAEKMEIAQSDLTRALEQAGLQLPDTAEGMWELMRSLDPATQAGREQIAMLIELTDVAGTYYSALEEIQNERLGLERQILQLQGDTAALRQIELEKLDESNRALQERIWALQDEQEIADIMSRAREDIAQLSLDPLVNEFRQLMVAHDNLIERARALGMSEQQLGVLRYRHQLELDRLTASLEESIRSIWEQLQGTNQGAGGSFGSSFTGAIDNAASQIRDSIIRALEGVRDWLNREDFEDPSLTPRARLAEMEEEFYRLIDVARTGSGQEQADAIAALPQLASQLKQLGVQVHGSATEPYQDFRNGIVEAMQSVLGIDVPDAQDPVTGSQVGAIGSSVDSVSQSQAQQTALAAQLLEQLGVLVEISGSQAPDIAERLGVNLGSVIGDLIGEVEQGSIETVEQLVAVANTLGMELTGVADAIGLHVGALADQESMFSEALENAILRMPPEIQGHLWGPLERIWSATSEADANAAIENLIDATGNLPAAYANLLAPFFDEIDTQDLHVAELGLLDQIRGILDNSAYTLTLIEAALQGTEPPPEPDDTQLPPAWIEPPPEIDPPHYAAGGWASGLIMTGERGPEVVVPHDISTFFQRVGWPISSGSGTDPRVAQYLARLVELEEQAYRQRADIGREQRDASIAIATSMDEVAREARSMAGMQR